MEHSTWHLKVGSEGGWRAAADHRMKNIGAEWRNLAEGLKCVEILEARFRAEWGARLDEARRRVEETRRRKNRRLGYAALGFALVLILVLLIVELAFRLPLGDIAILGLVIASPAIAILYGLKEFFGTSYAAPDPSSLTQRWWATISGRASSVRRSGPTLSARHYGDAGEEAFVSYLAGHLSDGYLAARGLLVVRNLDADVILVGPTGVWVYEVKHWSGSLA